MRDLDAALSEQLAFIFDLLGIGVFRDGVTTVKGEISEPLASRRELVKRFGVEEDFYRAIKSADKVVKMVRG